MSGDIDTSASFYREHSQRYADVAHSFGQSVYVSSSEAWLADDWDLLARAMQLAPGRRVLDAGCGAGARDVFKLWLEGCDVSGVDAIRENIEVARRMHPEIAERVAVADLREALPFADAEFDLVLCNAVIQHISPEDVFGRTLPEFVRVLRPGGLLQLMFKHGSGVLTLHDRDYAAERSFILYDEEAVVDALRAHGLEPVDTPERPGKLVYFTDTKDAPHCALHARKRVQGPAGTGQIR
jgi:SAM-dependent methyltransferase